jgi:mannitol/fructose-specific phosphotransferase system IIA component (Ntr-type)
MNDGGPIRLSELLRPELIAAPLESAEAAEAIAELVRLLALGGEIERDRIDEITALAVENERRSSTGIKRGLALPNCSAARLKRTCCALGVSPAGVDFRCLDKLPAHAVALFVCPQSTYKRVLLGLEAVADLFEETRLAEDLSGSASPEEALAVIERAEADDLLYEQH